MGDASTFALRLAEQTEHLERPEFYIKILSPTPAYTRTVYTHAHTSLPRPQRANARATFHFTLCAATRNQGTGVERKGEREREGGARYTHALLVLYLRSCTPGESKQARMKSRNPFVARARVHLVSLGSEFQFINENFIGTGVGYARGKYVCVQCMRWR